MTVKKTIVDRLEFTLIGLFKLVLLLALCVALVASGLFVARGASGLKTAASPLPEQSKPPAENFDQGSLLEALSPVTGTSAVSAPTSLSTAKEAVVDPNRELFEKQILDLWGIVQTYQAACGVSAPLTREQFVDGLRQSSLDSALRARGAEYAASQLLFTKQSLANPSVIKLCRDGKSGIFFKILEHHRTTWDRHQRDLREFAVAAREREEQFMHLEAQRVADAHADGYRQLMLAAAAFGAFMALAMVLIFARIEANLRGLKLST